MDVQTITMSKDAARAKLRQYRAARHTKADLEYQQAVQAYEAAAEGLPLLVLSEVIGQAPRDARGRPRLAIARADQRQVRYERHRYWTHETFSVNALLPGQRQLKLFGEISVPTTPATPAFRPAAPPPADAWWGDHMIHGYALVPIVPPDVRQGHDLAKHFTLWEVEAWSDTGLGVDADRDPYLLRRIHTDLYAVVGEWDLTEVERAITRGRRG